MLNDMQELPRTTLGELIIVLSKHLADVPHSDCARLDEWCSVFQTCFDRSEQKVYCHKSPPRGVRNYAESRGELGKYEEAEKHCNIQHDISILNRDTDDPSRANSHADYPRPEKSIFYNSPDKARVKCLDIDKLKEIA